MSSLALGLLAILGLLVAILYIAAPLMLYAIYTRLGETNDLLRHLAGIRSHLATTRQTAPPDMFRSLS